MKASDLIDVVKSLKIDDRTDLISGPPDELAEPVMLARLITQAQLEYCRYTGAMISAGPTDAVDQITLIAAQKIYPYSPAIVSISSIRLGDSDQALARASAAQFDTISAHLLNSDPWVPTETANSALGRPVAYALDTGTRTILLNAAPSADVVASAAKLYLRCIRYPIADVTVSTLDQELSIPAEAHYGLSDWIAAELLTTPNADRQQQRLAQTYRERFQRFLVEHRALALQRSGPRTTFRFNAFGPR